MSAHRMHYFGKGSQYILRPAEVDDLPLASLWTSEDPWHVGVASEFWIEQRPGVDSYLLYDDSGPVFFFKIVKVPLEWLELHIQFCTRMVSMPRIVNGLTSGMRWLEEELAKTDIRGIYFESRSPTLISFAKKRLGFIVAQQDRLFKSLNG